MLKQSTAAFSSSLLDLANTKLGVQYMQVRLLCPWQRAFIRVHG